MQATGELRALLAQEGFCRPLHLARAKVEEQGGARGAITLEGITPEEVRCLGALLGRAWYAPVAGADVPRLELRRIDAALRDSRFHCTLPEALELLHGRSLRDRRAARQALRDGREAIWERASTHPACADRRTAQWLEHVRRTGALARLAYAENGDGLIACLDAAALLPADPPEAQAVLAARLRGSAHALDAGQPCGALLVSLLAAWAQRSMPTGAAERRELLARFGVLSDSISCAVVALNLPVRGDGLVAGMTRLAAGRHVSLTLGNLACEPLPMLGCEVFMCENPTVLGEAERRLGAACPPLVCADGQFTTACLRLLEALVSGGCQIFVHGDFDWGGLHIVSRAMQTIGAEPWRYDVAAYRQAVATVPTTRLSSRAPRELDPQLQELAAAIGGDGRAVHEEALLDVLLDDLRANGSSVAI
jgi:uncharacterized protein (TIGR02679 family)